jgi:ketosteroid isomerase-like protein
MHSRQDYHPLVKEFVERFSDLVSHKDLAIVDEFSPNAILVGSEPGEIARGRIEIESFFKAFFAQPVRVRWRWHTMNVEAARDVVWFFVEGIAFAQGRGIKQQVPYRVAGVLRRRNQRWLWQQFHGAEPR